AIRGRRLDGGDGQRRRRPRQPTPRRAPANPGTRATPGAQADGDRDPGGGPGGRKKNGDGPAARPTLHLENRLSSARVRRSETARSFGTASPQKNCRGSFRDPALLPLSTPSKVVRRTLLRAPAPLHGG